MVDFNFIRERINTSTDIQHGKPCIKGTRVPVYVILEAMASGMDAKTIRKEYPPVTNEDINACLLYAACLANEEEITL